MRVCFFIKMENIFETLRVVDDFYWGYIGFFMLIGMGVYLSYKSGFYQLRVIRHLPSTIKKLIATSDNEPGVSPMRLYFASIGGMIGLGNIVAVITALLIGGPGALFWLWVASLVGMIIKYSEIYLGMRYRRQAGKDGYEGGLFFFLPQAFKGKLGVFLANIAAVLLCIYGVEIYQFTVITDTLDQAFEVSREVIIVGMLVVTLYMGMGGIKRLANVCTVLMPLFVLFYVLLCMYVLAVNAAILPEVLMNVLVSAFDGHAAMGGFAGSTIIMVMQQGAARAVYSGDIAIGFDSIIQSTSREVNPQRQARLAIMSMLTDTTVCTMSILVVMISGLWHTTPELMGSSYVAVALSDYVPYSQLIIGIVIFLAGFTTIQAYFAVGLKSAQFLSANWGKYIYYIFGVAAFYFFAHYDQSKALLIMSLSGGALIFINLLAIFKLRNEIRFDILKED